MNSSTPFDRVAERPEAALDRLVIDFVVGDGSLKLRVPVDQALAAIDEAIAEEIEKRLPDRTHAALVQGEPRPLPVTAAAQLPELLEDTRLVLILPGPDSPDQFVSTQIMPGLPFLLADSPLDDRLGGDSGVVGARDPQGVVALHAPPTNQYVLKRVIERVTEMEGARYVGRGDHNAKRLSLGVRPAAKVAALVPELKPAPLRILRIVLFRKFHCRGFA